LTENTIRGREGGREGVGERGERQKASPVT
jgi:hypothetical protein